MCCVFLLQLSVFQLCLSWLAVWFHHTPLLTGVRMRVFEHVNLATSQPLASRGFRREKFRFDAFIGTWWRSLSFCLVRKAVLQLLHQRTASRVVCVVPLRAQVWTCPSLRCGQGLRQKLLGFRLLLGASVCKRFSKSCVVKVQGVGH